MKPLALFLLALPCWAVIGTPVALTLIDRSTIARTGNVVLAGVPVPEAAAILDVRLLSITSDSAGLVNLDSHRLVTERWHGDPTDGTKSIKSILVAISSPTLAGSGTATVYLADRTGADPGTATTVTVNSSDTCADTTACTTVSTGVNKYWIRHDSFNLFDQVRRISDSHDYVSHSASGGFVAVTSAGTFTSATVPTATPGIPGYAISTEEPTGAFTANEDGANLYAQIKVSGALWNGTSPKFTEIGRLFFFGGDGSALLRGTHISSEDMFLLANQPTSVGLFLPNTLGSSLTATFGTLYGSESTTTAVSLTNTDDVWLAQTDHGNTAANTAPTIGTTATVNVPWYVCDDVGSTNAASQANCPGQTIKGWRLAKNNVTQATGYQADGWLSLDDGTNQINVFMPNFWQTYPNQLHINNGVLSVEIWPSRGDAHTDGRPIGDLTSEVGYKRDMALAGQTGFGHFWPWTTGPAMNLTVQSPNAARSYFSLISSAAGTPVVLSASFVNYKLNDSPCNGAGCNFWTPCTLSGGVCVFDATKARKVYNSGFTGAWTPLNGYKLAMWNGSTTTSGLSNFPQLAQFSVSGSPIDASAFGAVPVSCLGSVGACKVGTIDTMSDSQLDGTGKAFEVWFNFTSHAGAAPGNDAARWRDTLLFTNPTYFCDTSLFLGHVHAQDSINFPRQEAEITNYFNNLYKRNVVENVYGIYYGQELYGQGPTGFGGRYWASIGRRHGYDIAYWLQFLRTGDPAFFHRAQAIIQAVEAEIQHPPQVAVTTAYAGVGLDHTGTAASNPFWDTKHYTDSLNNLVAKHDGSGRCTASWGASVWFPIYNIPPTSLTGGGASINPCSDGQQPWLEYPSTSLRLNYDLVGDPRSRELAGSVANNVIFSAAGSGTRRTLVLDETSGIYNGGAFGRAFGGCMQAGTDAAEILGNGTVNYIALPDACFKDAIQDRSGINEWTQNPTGLIYDDNSIGAASATPSAAAHTHYGSHHFVAPWIDFPFAEYITYKGNANISAPTYAGGHAAQNTQTALNNMANGLLGYFNTTAKSGGLYSYQFPGRVVADSYAITSDAEALKYIKRSLDFHTNGADDAVQTTGCTQQGTLTLSGDTPSVPPATICFSPTAVAGTPPFDLSSTKNPNALTYGGPDIHIGGLLAVGLPYLEYPLVGISPVPPATPPTFVLVTPTAGAANGPTTWITNCPSCGSGFTFDLLARIAVSGDFGNLSQVTPVSGDWSLTVLDPSATPVSGITVQDSAGHTYTGAPTAVFKTPTQMWPPAAGGGAGVCLAAPAPPSINYDGSANSHDNRDFLVTVPAGANGAYTIQLTHAACDPAAIPVAAILSMSTTNLDLVTCTAPCSAISQFAKVETGSVQYVNVAGGVTKLQADSGTRFAVISPGGALFRGGTTRSLVSTAGKWAVMQNGAWESESSYSLTFGGVGGVKHLASPSPGYFFDSGAFSNQTFIPVPANVVTLNFLGILLEITGQVDITGGVVIH